MLEKLFSFQQSQFPWSLSYLISLSNKDLSIIFLVSVIQFLNPQHFVLCCFWEFQLPLKSLISFFCCCSTNSSTICTKKVIEVFPPTAHNCILAFCRFSHSQFILSLWKALTLHTFFSCSISSTKSCKLYTYARPKYHMPFFGFVTFCMTPDQKLHSYCCTTVSIYFPTCLQAVPCLLYLEFSWIIFPACFFNISPGPCDL